MSNLRDKDKKFALACVIGVLAIAGLIAWSWDGLQAWYVSYRSIWMPEGAEPTDRGHPISASSEVALHLDDAQDWRAGLWSLATREVLPLDVRVVFAINNAGDMVGSIFRAAPSGSSL